MLSSPLACTKPALPRRRRARLTRTCTAVGGAVRPPLLEGVECERLAGALMVGSTPAKVKLTPPEVAKMWGITPEKVIAFIRSGELRAINVATRLGGRPR